MTVEAGHFSTVGGFPSDTAVNVFTHGTTTLASLYADHSSGTTAPDPVTTDADGALSFYAVAGDVDLNWSVGDLERTVTVTVQPDPRNAWVGSDPRKGHHHAHTRRGRSCPGTSSGRPGECTHRVTNGELERGPRSVRRSPAAAGGVPRSLRPTSPQRTRPQSLLLWRSRGPRRIFLLWRRP